MQKTADWSLKRSQEYLKQRAEDQGEQNKRQKKGDADRDSKRGVDCGPRDIATEIVKGERIFIPQYGETNEFGEQLQDAPKFRYKLLQHQSFILESEGEPR